MPSPENSAWQAPTNFGRLDPAEPAPVAQPTGCARIRVLSGTAIGREVLLHKPLTTIGKLGRELAVVRREGERFLLDASSSRDRPLLNGVPAESVCVLRDGDLIELGRVQMLFVVE